MKITITSQDIARRNDMTAEEFAKYLFDKMSERKNERTRWMSEAFSTVFGI